MSRGGGGEVRREGDKCEKNILCLTKITIAINIFLVQSGNTWLRYLLQQSSGILTGSVNADPYLLEHGFPAENIANGSVHVVKTHEFDEQSRKSFEKVVLLVRNPSSAILAEFNRQMGGQVG